MVKRNRNELMYAFDEITEVIGQQEMLDNLFLALDTDTLYEILEYLDRQFELGLFSEEDEEEE